MSADPIGQFDNENLYQYAALDPVNEVDPFGLNNSLDLLIDASNFASGFGNTISFGLTGAINSATGASSVVNKCSTAYSLGGWAGVAWGFAAGGAGGFRAAGAKAAGKQFSHWIPSRALNRLASNLGPRAGRFATQTFGRSRLNGNYVSRAYHALSDPYARRFMSRAWKAANPPLSAAAQQLMRLPRALLGAGAGGAATGASKAAQGCGCNN